MGKTAIDSVDGDGGWYGSVAIVFSETCNCVITTSASQAGEDCAYAFDLDLNPMGPMVQPPDIVENNSQVFEVKAAALVKECCPVTPNMQVDTTLCANVNDEFFLQELINCNGSVCEGLWSEGCLLYTSPSPRDRTRSRMPSSA